jgi:hypothetical protein
MRQVWGILEVGFAIVFTPVDHIDSFLQIVREQCWLNEILSGCRWEPEGFSQSNSQVVVDDMGQASEGELQAILNGLFVLLRIICG